jgi:hypothetical protein
LEHHSTGYLYLYKKQKGTLFRSDKVIKVSRLSFPGWKRQVQPGMVKYIRTQLNLTETSGYDSRVIFEGVEPMYRLIEEFGGPLRRLQDR